MTNILTNLISSQAQKYGNREAISFREAGCDNDTITTWSQLNDKVNRLACSLAALGIDPGKKIAVFSANRPEIIITDFAAYSLRAIPVSIYATSSQSQVEYIVNDCQATIIFVGDQDQYQIALQAKASCPSLKLIVPYTDVLNGNEPAESTTLFSTLLTQDNSDMMEKVEAYRKAATPDDTATLIYTSGTTGEPKGAVLPHSCFDAVMEIHRERLTMLSDNDTSVTFLPLSHIFEKAWTCFCLFMGMKVYVNLDPKAIQDTLRRVNPTCMCSVPRFWEKVYTVIQDKMALMSPIRRGVLNYALKVGIKRNLDYKRHGKKAPWWLELRYKMFEKNIFAPLRRVIGVDNGNIFPTAGAAVSDNIVTFLHGCGINILVGYGLSETSATVTCYPNKDFEIGSVGTVMPRVQVKIGDNNEILVKGPTVLREYYNKPQATAEAFTEDGWFRTGDAGYITPNGSLVLTERIKDLFKTAGGKYIAPQMIESRLAENPYIEQVAVIADKRKFASALIVPAFTKLEDYAKQEGITYNSTTELINNEKINKMIEEHIERAQKDLARHEKIKRFTLLPKEFTMESGELTNTLKLKRPAINERYAGIIDKMYEC